MNRFMQRSAFCILCSFTTLFASEEKPPQPAYVPWYTGVLVATSAGNAAPGQLIIQPYTSLVFNYGDFQNNWKLKRDETEYTLVPQLLIQFGLTKWLDFSIETTMLSSYKGNAHSTRFSDLYTALGFKLMPDIPGTFVPDLRFVFSVQFPTGKHDRASIRKKGTDLSGEGCYIIGGTFAVRKAFSMFPYHPFRLGLDITFQGATEADIYGLSTYGGLTGVFGTVQPGSALLLNFNGEISLTQRWVFAFEAVYQYYAKAKIRNTNAAFLFDFKERMQLQIIPEIEYNWSPNLGIVGGVLVQYAATNSSALTTLSVSVVYTY